MELIIGLGNYGPEYEKTRHNYGFMVVERLRKKMDFPEFTTDNKHQAMVSIKDDVIMAEPQTYMNKSGKAVKSLASYYKIKPEDILIIHDDADIPLGEIKKAEGRGSAGHKGVQSVIEELKTNQFKRLRLGIYSEDPSFKDKDLEEVVLKNFSKEEDPIVEEAIDKAIKMINI
jgi:PTH1 family peptidyl-tRNA hydrolase